MEFFWKLAGADPNILKDSGEQSQKRFLLIGILYIIINLIIFVSFFGLFYGVFDTFFVGLFGALLMTFVIGNIYRLTLVSLEPQTLPVKKELGSMIASMGVRYTVVCLFAIFISKSLETTFLGFLVNGEVEQHIAAISSKGTSKFVYQESSLFLEHMILLNEHHPWVWTITVSVVLFFIMPVFLRASLRKKKEYYSIKRIIDKAIVEDNYFGVKKYLNSLYSNMYKAYNDKSFDFRHHEEHYLDPPFNTKLKSKESKIHGTMSDFANLDW